MLAKPDLVTYLVTFLIVDVVSSHHSLQQNRLLPRASFPTVGTIAFLSNYRANGRIDGILVTRSRSLSILSVTAANFTSMVVLPFYVAATLLPLSLP